MNETQLKKWKEKCSQSTFDVVNEISQNKRILNLKDFYPEFSFKGAYSTSLDPYVPLWALLPFFDKIIVGILPYLKSENEFIKWYGLSPHQMLRLHEMGRLEIRILYPKNIESTPSYLDDLLLECFPTSLRDFEFNKKLLTEDVREKYRERFKKLTNNCVGDVCIDTFKGNRDRALHTAETAYLQLIGLGYHNEALDFEHLFEGNESTALKWLEVCRLFLIGPIHYSFGGIHSVGGNAFGEYQKIKAKPIVFPRELGVILVKAFDLFKKSSDIKEFTLEDCISVYENSTLARDTLLALDKMIKSSKIQIETIEDLKNLFLKAKKRDVFWLSALKITAATAISVSAMSADPIIGLLAGLGFSIATEVKEKSLDKMYKPLSNKICQLVQDPSLTLLVQLDEDVKKNYKGAK